MEKNKCRRIWSYLQLRDQHKLAKIDRHKIDEFSQEYIREMCSSRYFHIDYLFGKFQARRQNNKNVQLWGYRQHLRYYYEKIRM